MVVLLFSGGKKRSWSYLLFLFNFLDISSVCCADRIFPFVLMGLQSKSFPGIINLIPFYINIAQIIKYCFIEYWECFFYHSFRIWDKFPCEVKPRKILGLAFAVGFGFEFSNLLFPFFQKRFRSIDINDVMLNALGVLFGYALFIIFAWAYIQFGGHFKIKYKGLFCRYLRYCDPKPVRLINHERKWSEN